MKFPMRFQVTSLSDLARHLSFANFVRRAERFVTLRVLGRLLPVSEAPRNGTLGRLCSQ